jgi:hypothetical protein
MDARTVRSRNSREMSNAVSAFQFAVLCSIAVLVTGCATQAQKDAARAQKMAALKADCESIGAKAGTDAHIKCAAVLGLGACWEVPAFIDCVYASVYGCDRFVFR